MNTPARHLDSLSEEGRYRLLVDAVTDYAIYMLDADGRVSSWNAGAQRFKGYAPDEIIGEHFSRFYIEEDRNDGLPARALATAAREGKFEGEGWRVRKDGQRFWAHVVIDPIRGAAGELIGYAKIIRDLTERRAAEQELRRSQEQFRLLVQGVTDYAIYMLDTEGRITSWNAGAERIKGYSQAEVIGRHFSDFYRPADRQNGEPMRALETAAREGRFESEGWRVRKDGTHFRAHVIVDPIRDDSGTIIGYAKVTRDVTARREAQRALELAQESLFQSQKLDAIGQLTGGVAHDFNNLLMVILSSLTMIGRRVGNDPKLGGLIENAVKATQRGAALTQRMLSFARRQALNPVPVDVAALVHGMWDLLSRSLGPAIAVRFSSEPGLRRVRADPNQLELALLNLAVNARDAMPAGGTIEISAAEVSVDAPQPKLAAGAYVRLRLVDDGVGMDQATLARATEPFFTTKGVGKGTGLGLSMVEGLASQSGGQFVLSSRPGAGTTAELWLPVSDAGPDVAAASPPVERAAARPLKVLAVDDDCLVLDNTLAMLEDMGHDAIGAGSAEEALNRLRGDRTVQLLLTDHAMPRMTGADLVAVARRERPELPVVLATGYAELGPDLPPVTRLAKPFGQDDLARAIAAASEFAAPPA